ncbi:hypothetical protein Tco_0831646, partial [Tanacetum coccineum]
DNLSHRIALGMERDCQHGLYKAGMGSSRVLSDFAEKYGSKNRVLAGFGIGGKSGKEKDKDLMAMIASLGEQERLMAEMMILKSSQN